MTKLELACPWMFAAVAMAASIFLAWNMPPFMGADEIVHFLRADQGAHGRIVGHRFTQFGKTVAGGESEVALMDAAHIFETMAFHPERKASPEAYQRAAALDWKGAADTFEFSGAAPYPPFFYLPASAAMFLGHHLDWTVLDTLYATRLAQALACIAVGFAALSLAGRSRLVLYAALTLPMTLGLFATVNTDGLLVATTALGCAILCRPLSEGRACRPGELAAAAACFALIGMGKPPYALFALLLAVAPSARPRFGWWACAAALAAAFGWLAFTALAVQVRLEPGVAGVDPAGQIRSLLGNPFAVLKVANDTLDANAKAYSVTMIGVLGWLDTVLPSAYYNAAWVALGLAALSAAPRSMAPHAGLRLAALLVVLGGFGAVNLALYVTWTPVGATVVQGVAGRYFLPLICALAVVLESPRALIPEAGLLRSPSRAPTAAVLLFPIVSLVVIERAVVARYYLD